MTLPIYKKTIFDTMKNKQLEISEEINEADRKDIERLMGLFVKNRTARGQWQIPRQQGMELLPYFKKYVDNKVSPNIFGCGGCATKMVDYMFSIYKIWQSPIK